MHARQRSSTTRKPAKAEPPSKTGLAEIIESIEGPLGEVRALIGRQLSDSGQIIGPLVSAFSAESGKMLRPAFLLLSGRCFGDVTEGHIRAAAVVQMIHNATLLHDDVIDHGLERRGQPTINAIWGNEAAVLLGDMILSKASVLCADMEPNIFRLISTATSRVCKGELTQILNRNNWQFTETGYIEMVTEKSASLFAACCEIGARLSGAHDAEIAAVSAFGLHTGIAFQITDDLLDIVGEEKETGKTAGRDFDRNKLTLPLIHLLKTLEEKQRREFVARHLGSGAATGGKSRRQAVRKMLESTGSIEYARNRVREHAEEAIKMLEGIGAGEGRAALVKTARFIEAASL